MRPNLEREILVLVPALPPTPRALKLCQHLLSFDWRPCLLAPKRPDRADWRFGGLPEDVHVETTRFLRPLSERLRPRGASAKATSREQGPEAGRAGSFGILGGLARRALLWANTPDDAAGWLPFAVARALKLARERPIRALLATGPPFTTVVAGSLVARATGLPLVADFRDAWTLDEADPFGTIGGNFRAPFGRPRRKALRWLEERCLSASGLVLFTSRFTQDRYLETFPALKEKALLLLNGVDEGDYEAPPERLDGFTFTCIGSFHEFQWPQVDLLLAALALARERYSAFATARLRLGGFMGTAFTERLNQGIAARGLAATVCVEGVMPHARAVALQKGSGALVLFAGANRFIRLTKVSDCMAIGRPTLAMAAADGETGRCIREIGGHVYSGASTEELAGILWELFQQGPPAIAPEAPFPFPYPHPLHWRTSVERLARRLDALGPR